MKELTGFGNHFSSEAVPGTLPERGNSPQKPPRGLYAEQLSGTAFTAPRGANQRSWLYRIRPSVGHGAFEPFTPHAGAHSQTADTHAPPDQMRWDPLPYPDQPTDFLSGHVRMAENGSHRERSGSAVYLYAINRGMEDRFFYDADGDLLFVPQEGALDFRTELGNFRLEPNEIAVIQRGIRFQVTPNGHARGYLCENYGAPFRLPELGPIGANGLANPRDFRTPSASYENRSGRFELCVKFDGRLWRAETDHSPLDVVAWHGNYAPYKYDLRLFNTIGTVSYDHPDPSIFTVLTSPSPVGGTANVDFVVFPPRWMVATDTFRPPYYHRNVMSEFMGLITGQYDAKPVGFVPGGSSLHNCMSPHGPDAATFKKATGADLKPEYYANVMAFMFESSMVFRPTEFALKAKIRQRDYLDCWKGLEAHFKA